MRPQPLIAVADVEATSRWYQRLLGCQSDHGGPEYERLVDGDTLIMQLHHWKVDHDHGAVGDPDDRPYGNGVLLWFEIEDFDAAVARADELHAEIVLAPHRNRRTAAAALITARSGSRIPTATGSYSPVPTARQGRRPNSACSICSANLAKSPAPFMSTTKTEEPRGENVEVSPRQSPPQMDTRKGLLSGRRADAAALAIVLVAVLAGLAPSILRPDPRLYRP